MKYWSRIDLHQHTNHDIDCTGKHCDNNYTHNDYYKWLAEENVKLKAVTCHNNIDLSSHLKHAIIADLLGINHLVGVEIDYKFENLEFHAISILSPNVDVIDFSERLKKIREEKNNQIYLSKDDFCELHKNIEFIFIPHAIKDKGILEQKIGNLESSTIDWVIKSIISGVGEPVLFENTKDYHIYSVVEKINKILNLENVDVEISAYVGDDFRFDNDENRKNKIRNRTKYSINSKPTYRGLELALRNPKTRLSLESQIINREKFIESIKIEKNKSIEESLVEFSPGLNVIIGNSGSGKTLLLNQIYFELTGNNLKAAAKKSEKTKENLYKGKVGTKDILNVKFDQMIDKSGIKILEIPNIYSEILKFQNDDSSEIPKMFGIDDITNSDEIVTSFKLKIQEYLKNINQINSNFSNGEQNLINIKSAIDFLNKNKISNVTFNLNTVLYNTNNLDDINKKMKDMKNYVDNYDKIKKYFEKIKSYLSNDNGKSAIDNILINYEIVINELKCELMILEKKYKNFVFEKQIYDKINSSINKSIELLGAKEKSCKQREQIIVSELNDFCQNIKDNILLELDNSKIDLSFPYFELKGELEKNYNDYARLTLNISDIDIKNTSIIESELFDCANIKIKIRESIKEKYNLLNSHDVKKLAQALNLIDINLSNIILDANRIPKNIELYLSERDEWRFIQNINKGDIAKKSLEYYFNKLVKDNQPDIILIDQPENDVDKTFISETLSLFIKEQKLDKQVIVTSHDAIIAVNSDVNKIIEASVTDDNKIKYESYDLEYVEQEKLVATNRVAKILDGGKQNIKIRYQIYGGELNYENRNI